MNTNLTPLLPTGSMPQAVHEPAARGLSTPARQRGREQRRLPAHSARVIPLADYSEYGDSCHRDFDALLMGMLARLTNCAAEQLERDLKAWFWRVCEFLEIDRAGLWRRSSKDAESFTLTQLYPAPETLSARGEPGMISGASNGQAEPGVRPLLLEVGADSRTCFPWLTAEVERGEAIAFSDLAHLPTGAEYDKTALARIGVHSSVVIPFLAQAQVLGAASFTVSRAGATWPEALLERLKFVAHIFANAIARKAREDELSAALGTIKQLKERLQAESDYLKVEIKVSQAHGEILGRSQGIKRVLHQVEQVAPADCAVLLNGETGTGKELVAEEIHRLSRRRERHMVLVNCAALPSALVESELFGRERGAYTGALSSQVGRFEIADGSTIFLDEVGELSMEVQAKLLRVLQQGEFQRLGSPKTHKVDVRVIAATNRDLAGEVRKGRFREDLYYRLKVFPIEIPPLRERVEDIPLLVFAFMEEFSTRMGKKLTKVPRKGMEALQRHSWPGNIRELRNVIEHSVILSSGDTLKLSSFGDAPTRDAKPITLAEAEREHILKTLESTGWRIKGAHGAALRLDMQPSTLYSRMQKLGIPHRRQKDEIPT